MTWHADQWPLTPTAGMTCTRDSSLIHAGGKSLFREGVAIAGTGAQTLNIATIAGCVTLMEITMIASTVTDSTTFSNVKFALYDGTNTVDLTAVVDGSSCVTGSKFFKTAVAATALTYLNADQVRFAESVFNKPFVESIVNAKPAVTNYLQLLFTGDGDTDITANFHVVWRPACSNGLVAAPA